MLQNITDTTEIHIEQIKIGGYSLNYVCSSRFKGIRQSISLKYF